MKVYANFSLLATININSIQVTLGMIDIGMRKREKTQLAYLHKFVILTLPGISEEEQARKPRSYASPKLCPPTHSLTHSQGTVVMDVPEIIGLYNVKSILTDNSI